MKTKTKIRLAKVLVVLLYAVLIIVPMVRAQFEEVNIVDSKIIYNIEKQGDDMILTCDKNVVSGTVTIRIYKNEDVIKTLTKKFEDNEGKTFTVTILDEDIPDYATEYKLFDARVTTETQEIVEIICWLPLIVFLIFVPFIFKIRVYETTVDDNQVEVYVGIKKKSMKVNGNLVQETKKVFYSKPIIFEYVLGEKTIVAEIGKGGKVKIYSKLNQIENLEENEEASSETEAKSDGLSKEENMASELFAKMDEDQTILNETKTEVEKIKTEEETVKTEEEKVKTKNSEKSEKSKSNKKVQK